MAGDGKARPLYVVSQAIIAAEEQHGAARWQMISQRET
jgi:hypothetical protein